MAATTYAAMAVQKQQLVRKALQGSVFLAPYSATLPASMTTGSSSALNALPAGYTDVGLVDKKSGVTWGRKVTTADTPAWGFAQPVRRDVTAVDMTIKFMMLETSKTSLGLQNGLDLSAVTADSTTKEITFASPSRPATIYYRMFGLFVDGAGTAQIFVGKSAPKVAITDVSDEQWTDGEVVGYEVTATAFVDSVAGYSMQYYYGGPGWAASGYTDAGFS